MSNYCAAWTGPWCERLDPDSEDDGASPISSPGIATNTFQVNKKWMESMSIYRSSSPKLQRVFFKNDGEEQKNRRNPASQFACQYRIAPSKVRETAQKVIYSYYPHLREANIAFLFRFGNWKSKGRVVTGKAAPVPELWRFLSGCDLALRNHLACPPG